MAANSGEKTSRGKRVLQSAESLKCRLLKMSFRWGIRAQFLNDPRQMAEHIVNLFLGVIEAEAETNARSGSRGAGAHRQQNRRRVE